MKGRIMELLQLKYFQTVARFEHVTRAAEELGIPQPSLSKTIALLEKELGVLLFDRRGRYIHLNEYGKTFLRRVDVALNALEDGKRELSDLGGKTLGDIKLAVLAASNMLPDILAAFCEKHPHIRFQLLQHFSRSSTRPGFDLCISSSLLDAQESNSISLITEEIFLAVPSDHPLAKKGRIQLKEVEDEDFISLRPGKILREITDTFCQYAGFTPRIIFESDDPATVRGLIRAGQGIAFIPAISWGGSAGSSMVLLHIEEPICKRTISLSWTKDRYLPPSAILFRQFTIDYFAKFQN